MAEKAQVTESTDMKFTDEELHKNIKMFNKKNEIWLQN